MKHQAENTLAELSSLKKVYEELFHSLFLSIDLQIEEWRSLQSEQAASTFQFPLNTSMRATQKRKKKRRTWRS